jgi:hypothetical protein
MPLVLESSRTQGQYDNGNDLAVVDLVRDLATVCDDAAVVASLNRLGDRASLFVDV